MTYFSKENIKNLAKEYGFSPSKGLGQNFLVDENVVRKVIEAAEIKDNDIVLEIGPGLGALTRGLIDEAKQVVAVEKDHKMVKILKNLFSEAKNLEIMESDIRKFSPKKDFLGYKAVGSLPFYLTAPVIRRFLEAVDVKPQQMVFVVQKEVAQRICAQPPQSKRINPLLHPSLPLGKMSILAVSVQFYAEAKIISYISKDSFWPRPKVDAAIIRMIPFAKPNLAKEKTELFFKIVKAGFSQPRKQLPNNLSKKLELDRAETERWLAENSIEPKRRAETLEVKDWINLTKSFKIKQYED